MTAQQRLLFDTSSFITPPPPSIPVVMCRINGKIIKYVVLNRIGKGNSSNLGMDLVGQKVVS
jgi:hypothetical protein